MNPRPTFYHAIQLAGLTLVAASLAWLIFGVAGDRSGMRTFPDADGSMIEVLRSGESGLELVDVQAAPADVWQLWNGKDYIRPLKGHEVWIKVTLRNRGTESVEGVLHDTGYFPDLVKAWVEKDGDGWVTMESGEAVPSERKPLMSRTAAFPVKVSPGVDRIVYLRTTDYYEVYLQPTWWPRSADFFAAQLRDTLADSICYGALAALILYNAILWVRLRFPETGCYVVYASASAVFNFVTNGGLAMLGVAVPSPWKDMILTGALAFSGVFVVQFARLFLGTKAGMPNMDRLLATLRVVLALLATGASVMPWAHGSIWWNLIVPTVAATHLLLFLAAVASWRAGVSHARFFVAAFGVLLAGAVPGVAIWIRQDLAAWAAMSLLGGSTLEMLFLSFGVADRFARIQREREEAQTRLIEETEQRRAIQEAYADELEVEVRERTRELVEANADKDRMIAIIGHDLRSPLTALTRTAENLSAGGTAETSQARFIGDAAHLGRQVLLLIEDLVLWARLRAGSKHLVAQPVSGLVAPVLALYQSQAKRSGLTLEMEAGGDLRVTTDLVLAQTLVRNLVANALRYAKSQVLITATGGAGRVLITVRDDGPGLPPVVAARLTQVAASPDWAGNGLGLRLCMEISRALDAGLSAKPAERGGTEFSFTLPERSNGQARD